MGTTWAKGSAGAFADFPNIIIDRLRARMQAAMEEVITQAVADMRRFTETRPSAKSGRQGRVDTAEMLESIAGNTFNEGVDKIIGEFGFINRQDAYFKFQTVTGFTHYLSGDFIEPTFAMRDAEIIAIQSLLQKLNEPL